MPELRMKLILQEGRGQAKRRQPNWVGQQIEVGQIPPEKKVDGPEIQRPYRPRVGEILGSA